MKKSKAAGALKKEVEDRLSENGIFPNHLIQHDDGTFTINRSLFHSFDGSAQKLAEKIKKALPGSEIIETHDEETYDNWNDQLETSYFVVTFRITEQKDEENGSSK